MLKVGPTEVERQQVIAGLQAGLSYGDATAELRKSVEADWFERNETHLIEVAKGGVKAPADPPKDKGSKK